MVRFLLALLISPLVAVSAVGKLRIVSPLQALTIYDPEVAQEDTRRNRFLPKFKAGLEAEAAVRKEFAEKRKEQQQALAAAAQGGPGWARRVKRAERELRKAETKAVEAAFEKATQSYEAALQQQQEKQTSKINPNNYQFVGVIQPPSRHSSSTGSPITWYARKKPAEAKWSVRLVHPNRQAILKDMFGQGKVDVFAKYSNSGRVDPETGLPVIKSEYKIRERSWRNLWNFSPKHFFTDSSGMYWRERRLRPGLYTDGKVVYESSYRYRDGRNGMHKKSSLETFLKSSAIPKKVKDRIRTRLSTDAPDIVLEE